MFPEAKLEGTHIDKALSMASESDDAASYAAIAKDFSTCEQLQPCVELRTKTRNLKT